MKANELRLGNLVHAKLASGKGRTVVHKITGYNIANLSDGLTSSFVFEPIPLTEEWLLKFGFDPKDNRDISGYVKNNLVVEWLFDRWTGRLYYDFKTSVQIIKLEYVHQLQNLFYALTGQELTI